MHVEWKTVTGKPQVMRKLKEFAKVCCTCNTSQKLALRTSVTAVTLLAELPVVTEIWNSVQLIFSLDIVYILVSLRQC